MTLQLSDVKRAIFQMTLPLGIFNHQISAGWHACKQLWNGLLESFPT